MVKTDYDIGIRADVAGIRRRGNIGDLQSAQRFDLETVWSFKSLPGDSLCSASKRQGLSVSA
jgi:hypothetical protein